MSKNCFLIFLKLKTFRFKSNLDKYIRQKNVKYLNSILKFEKFNKKNRRIKLILAEISIFMKLEIDSKVRKKILKISFILNTGSLLLHVMSQSI